MALSISEIIYDFFGDKYHDEQKGQHECPVFLFKKPGQDVTHEGQLNKGSKCTDK